MACSNYWKQNLQNLETGRRVESVKIGNQISAEHRQQRMESRCRTRGGHWWWRPWRSWPRHSPHCLYPLIWGCPHSSSWPGLSERPRGQQQPWQWSSKKSRWETGGRSNWKCRRRGQMSSHWSRERGSHRCRWSGVPRPCTAPTQWRGRSSWAQSRAKYRTGFQMPFLLKSSFRRNLWQWRYIGRIRWRP